MSASFAACGHFHHACGLLTLPVSRRLDCPNRATACGDGDSPPRQASGPPAKPQNAPVSRLLPQFACVFSKTSAANCAKGSPFSCEYGARPPRMSSCMAFSAGRPLFRIGKGGFCGAWIHNLQTLLKNSANKGAIQYSHNETRPERPHGKERLSGNAPHRKRRHTLYHGAAENGNFLDGGRSVPDVLRPRGRGACGKRGAGLVQMARNTAKALGRTDAMRRRGALGAQGVDS